MLENLWQHQRRFRHLASKVKTYAEIALLPANVWGTKGFQFWTFLSLLLLESECSRILELGSGRSTITLAEYAHFRAAHFVSIETSRRWFNKARFDLRLLGMSDDPVHLIEWGSDGTWYDIEQFRETVGEDCSYDFAFIDGPNRPYGPSRGIRDDKAALKEIRRCIHDADVMIVDDVHRRHILESVEAMLGEPNQYEKWFYDYRVDRRYLNTLCICVKKGSRTGAELKTIQSMLDIALYVTPKGCPEE